jgi:YHS domain-containing protein
MRLLSMIVRSRWDGGIDLAHRNKEVSAMAKDPVCAMEVDDQTAKWTSTYEGKRYSFCSAGCKESFDKDLGRYLLESDLLGRKIKPQ